MSVTNSWAEKYRPKTLDDVQGQEEVIRLLKASLNSGLPNLLFYGPPGSGKTTSILAVARDLFKDRMKERVLELNASNERGINVIREKLKTYCMQEPSHYDGIPDYKLVILDESDALTVDAQSALRRMMEDFTKTTRFCLICNYIAKIIPPIASRGIKFRFGSLPKEIVSKRLKMICEKEGMKVTDEAIDAVAVLSDGDLRYAIGLLQKLSQGIDGQITPQDISNVAGVVPSKQITELINECKKPNGSVNNIYTKVLGIVVEQNYSADSVLSQLRDIYIEDTVGLTEEQRCQFLLLIAQADKALVDKTEPLFTICSVLCSLFRLYHNL